MATEPEKNELPAAVAEHAQPLALQIISLTGEQWSGEVREVSLPGSEGRFGVMARHVPILSILREGMVHIHPAGGEAPLQVYVSGGYAEVQPDKVIVMADLAVRDAHLDQARAEAARLAAASPMATQFTDTVYAEMHLELVHRYSAQLRLHTPK